MTIQEKLRKSNELTRRQFVTAAASAYLGVSVLGHGATAWAQTPSSASKAKRVIYLYMAGGMSHMDTFDPKPGTAEQGPIKAINTSVPGVQMGEYLPQLAKRMNKLALIRSMNSREGSHERGTYLVHTSYPPLGGIEHPAVGAWSLRLAGPLNKTLPNYVVVGGREAAGSGYMGPKFSPAIIGNPLMGLQNVGRPSHIADVDYAKTLSLIDELDADFRTRYRSNRINSYTDFYERAVQLMASDDVKAFDITQEPDDVRKKYGDNYFGQGLLLARRLVEKDVRFIEVNFGGWDMHVNHQQALQGRLPTVDQGVSTLIDDLDSKGLLKDTLVVIATEFGRTPRISDRNGRDHWPAAWSTLLAGGGVQGSAVYGKTDAKAEKVTENGVTPQDFNATIAYALGVQHDQVVHDETSGRPFRMGGIEGKPVTAIF